MTVEIYTMYRDNAFLAQKLYKFFDRGYINGDFLSQIMTRILFCAHLSNKKQDISKNNEN